MVSNRVIRKQLSPQITLVVLQQKNEKGVKTCCFRHFASKIGPMLWGYFLLHNDHVWHAEIAYQQF